MWRWGERREESADDEGAEERYREGRIVLIYDLCVPGMHCEKERVIVMRTYCEPTKIQTT
jgi:hypothetical protein